MTGKKRRGGNMATSDKTKEKRLLDRTVDKVRAFCMKYGVSIYVTPDGKAIMSKDPDPILPDEII